VQTTTVWKILVERRAIDTLFRRISIATRRSRSEHMRQQEVAKKVRNATERKQRLKVYVVESTIFIFIWETDRLKIFPVQKRFEMKIQYCHRLTDA